MAEETAAAAAVLSEKSIRKAAEWFICAKPITGNIWAHIGCSTIPYKQLLDDTYSMNYLASFALQNGGKQGSLIRIQMETGKYVLPYYMVPGAGNYQVQTSDVLYSGNTSEPYELYNYFYDYAAEGGFGELPAQYAAAEAAYRNFVRNEYLAVPETTQSYLKYVIRQQRFDASDPSVISKVANYVQGAAQYNWKYDRLLDVQSDIVVAFLRDFKEGICQHYASAATLLFRMPRFPRPLYGRLRGQGGGGRMDGYFRIGRTCVGRSIYRRIRLGICGGYGRRSRFRRSGRGQ